jgi:hypothetical protein
VAIDEIADVADSQLAELDLRLYPYLGLGAFRNRISRPVFPAQTFARNDPIALCDRKD